FKESFQKALRSLETGALGFSAWKGINEDNLPSNKTLLANIRKPTAERVFHLRLALFAGIPIEEIHAVTGIDPWFLDQLNQIVEMEKFICGQDVNDLDEDLLRRAKEWGFSDHQLGILLNCELRQVRARRDDLGIDTQFRLVDTCAAEFEASTPYFYSSYGDENELVPSDRKKIMIIGGGPNRIGQGIEFDYCCVHASFALREIGIETVMVNSNPETVSTDYDTSDKLYFEPLTLEDISEIFHQEKCDGAIVQFGGQTPLTLALELKAAGVHIIGTTPEDIEVAEDRKHFKAILDKIGLKQPENDIALAREEASAKASAIGYPVLLRPSFVLGGRGMFIVFDDEELMSVVDEVFDVAPGKPVLLDKFLDEAMELDVDCISDGKTSVIGGILQHIEYAGVHSGDATMVMPPHSLEESMRQIICEATYALARELNVVGLMNVQFAVKDNELFVLEVNPRASRTVPFVSKVIGKPLAKMAARVMVGETLEEMGFTQEVHPPFWAVKESVFPFSKFPGANITLSPEMKSTGEVMGLDKDLGMAYAKAQMAAKPALPMQGNVFISVKDRDKPIAVDVAQDLVTLGFKIYSTSGTTAVLEENGVEVSPLFRIGEGRPTVIDMLKNDKIDMIVNTPAGQLPRKHENAIRTEAVLRNVCIMTSMTSAQAAVNGIRALKENPLEVKCLQQYAADLD
ncbi:MAG: carbamoyl-phosphate synthase large subunit, partial [Opitutales bacterium]|nr:carbamoyl-phosphate synthase large subunit [Opitutales bacterium]